MTELKDGEVQTIFTSPPYWNELYSEGGGLGNEKTSEEFVVNLSEHLNDYRVLNKRFFLFKLRRYIFRWRFTKCSHRVVDRLKSKGWILRTQLFGVRPIQNLIIKIKSLSII